MEISSYQLFVQYRGGKGPLVYFDSDYITLQICGLHAD